MKILNLEGRQKVSSIAVVPYEEESEFEEDDTQDPLEEGQEQEQVATENNESNE